MTGCGGIMNGDHYNLLQFITIPTPKLYRRSSSTFGIIMIHSMKYVMQIHVEGQYVTYAVKLYTLNTCIT